MNKKKVAVCIAILLIFSVLTPVFCFAAEERQVVRVALALQDGLVERDENGALSGYTYDYLQRVSQINSWDMEYIVFDDEDLNVRIRKAINAVKSGEADIIGAVLRNSAMEEMYEYPDREYGVVYTTISSLLENTEISDANYLTFSPLRIAVVETAKTRNSELISFLTANNVVYELVKCNDKVEQYQSLVDNRADVMLEVSLNAIPNTRTIASFAGRAFYFITTKGNTDISSQLDSAINKINQAFPYFQRNLQQKYFGDISSSFYISDEETDYIKNKKLIRGLCVTDAAPFVFQTDEGKPCGIAFSLMEDFAKKTGFTTEYDFYDPSQDFSTALKSKDYDFIFGLPINPDYNTAHGIITSNPYMNVNTVMFTNPSSQGKAHSQQTVALLRGSTLADKIDAKEIHYYNTTEECVRAVKNGAADRSYGNLRSVEYYSYRMFANLNMVVLYGQERDMEISVLNRADTVFLKILNRYIDSVTENQLYEYSMHVSEHNQKNSLELFIRSNPITLIVLSTIFLFSVFSAILMLIVTKRMKDKNHQLILANGAKSEFLARMSHDLRTPMNAIIGMAYLGVDSQDLCESKQYFQKVCLSGKYLLGLINDTLDMSKIENDKMVLNPEPYYSTDFISSVSNIVLPKAEEKNIELAIKIVKDTEYPLLFDKLRIQQIFINLLNNAIKFTPNGGKVDFILEVLSDIGEKACLRFIVRDNGVGMDESFQKKMYIAFEQEKGVHQYGESGTGLGLPIVKRLVELMGGKISCKSSPNNGTEFTVFLYPPIITAKEAATDFPRQAGSIENEVILEGRRVLVVEDHPLNMQIACKLLEKKGVIITMAKNGREGVDAFINAPVGYFDAVLMDIRMPVMDGLEATKVIRALDRADAQVIPIIAMTANAYDEDREKSKQAGLSAHLAKPIEPHELYESLYRFISKNEK
ncbi:MAG: transporter substrate-binding domain-containing protein [Angelakisella sp.]